MKTRDPWEGIDCNQIGMRANALLPQAYDPAFTNFRIHFNALAEGQTELKRTGPIRSNPVPFALVANAAAIVIASNNPHRTGLMIKNLDPTDNLYIGFGILADVNGFSVEPLQTIILDRESCPTDTISAFGTANIRGYLLELAPVAE